MLNTLQDKPLSHEMLRIITATHHDPFEVLGPHPLEAESNSDADTVVRIYLPGARSAELLANQKLHSLSRIEGTDFFEWLGLGESLRITR
jgi:1,4-alpha-glucan branching enzyme